MVNIIRRFQKPLLITITILVIISFAWLYNRNTMTDRGGGPAAYAYGKPVSQASIVRLSRGYGLAEELQASELVMGLLGRDVAMGVMFGQVPRDQAAQLYVVGEIVLEHEAERLGIRPTEREIEETVMKFGKFLTDGKFDSSKYTTFVSTILKPLGMTARVIEEVAIDQIRLQKVKELVGTGAAVSPAAIKAAYAQRFQKMEASVIRLKIADFLAAVALTDEDLQKAYKEREATLKTPELRKVSFVAFPTPKQDGKALEGDARIKAAQEVANRASDFYINVTENKLPFAEAAAKAGVAVQDTPAFPETAAPEALGSVASAAQAAFKLTKESPVSDVLPINDGYYILQLGEVTEPKALTFDESKEQLTTALKDERSKEAMNLKAADIRKKLDEALQAGKSMAEAAQAAGTTAEAVPAFSMSDRGKLTIPDGEEILAAAADLADNQLGEFTPTSTGGFLLHLDKRLAVDEADFEKQKDRMTQSYSRQQIDTLFSEWMQARTKEADIKSTRG